MNLRFKYSAAVFTAGLLTVFTTILLYYSLCKNSPLTSFYDILKLMIAEGILLTSITTAVTVFVNNKTAGNIRELIKTVNRIGERDFYLQTKIKTKDEIGELADSIKTMLQNLSSSMIKKEILESEIRTRKEEENKFINLFRTMAEGFATHEIILDEKGVPCNYRFLSINPAFEKYTGIGADAVGKTILEILPGIEKEWIKTYGKVALTGESVTFEKYSSALDQYFHVVSFSPRSGEFAVVFTDITKQKRTEQALQEEREKLSVTLKSIGEGVITADLNGNIVMMNRVAEKLTGWSNQEASGRPIPEVFNTINEFTRELCANPVQKVIEAGSAIELSDHTLLISRDGKEMIIEESGAPITDNKKRTAGAVLVFKDSTEKIKLNQTVMKTQKLESLGVLAGGIAHDFNNLLAGLFGYIELSVSCMDMNKPDLAKDYLTKSMTVYDRAKGLTMQLLTFSKGGKPNRKKNDLIPIIKNSITFALSGSSITPLFSLNKNLRLCDCDENQIAQCIDIIILNAIQAMPMGGELQISAENIQEPPAALKEKAKTDNYIKIAITDHGIGIPEEIIESIFDPFFSTKDSGHGLGLATVFSIIQHHDGWIDVDSSPGKGSKFSIYLPSAGEDESVCNSNTDIQSGSGKILLMDDEEFIIEIVDEMLRLMGYDVVSTKTGEEAVESVKEAAAKMDSFDACILDLTIPGGMGGKEAAERIKQLSPETVIIAASGYSEDPVFSNPSGYGFNDSIVKPFRISELSDVLKKNLQSRPVIS